jgi:YggT family protein
MNLYIIWIINLVVNVIGILLLVYIILSYFMSPYHPVREALSRIVDPILNPIRLVMPPIAGLDFSPLILWLILRLIDQLLVSLIASL